MDPNQNQASPQQPQAQPPNNQGSKKGVSPHIVWGLVVVILLAALGYFVYTTMQQDSQMAEMETQLTETQETLEIVSAESNEVEEETGEDQTEPATNPDEPVSSGTSEERYIGIDSLNPKLNSANIGLLYRYEGEIDYDTFHLEYGTTSDQLNSSTTPIGKELGAGDDIEPGLRSYGVYVDGLESDQRYFFKIVGTTDDGDTYKSDLASFRTGK